MEFVKQIHVLAALLSVMGFALRGFWMMQNSSVLQHKAVKIVPHINDSILLGSAITLAIMTQQYPGTVPWLTAKVSALLVYIGLGLVAFRFGQTKQIRIGAWLMALCVFGYIIGVAITKSPILTH